MCYLYSHSFFSPLRIPAVWKCGWNRVARRCVVAMLRDEYLRPRERRGKRERVLTFSPSILNWIVNGTQSLSLWKPHRKWFRLSYSLCDLLGRQGGGVELSWSIESGLFTSGSIKKIASKWYKNTLSPSNWNAGRVTVFIPEISFPVPFAAMQLCSSYIRRHHSICAWSQFPFLFLWIWGVEGQRRLASPIQQWIRHNADKNQELQRAARVCVQLTEMVAAQGDSFHPNDSAENEVPCVLFVCSLFFASFLSLFFFPLRLSRPLSLMSLRLSADMLSSLFIFREGCMELSSRQLLFF